MKNLLLIPFVLLTITVAIGYSCNQKEKIVYVTKPTINDSTLLVAKFKFKDWNNILGTIIGQSRKINSHFQDSASCKKSLDTIALSVEYIIHNINDSVNNPIFKK